MYFVVLLMDKTKLCIPAYWLQHINIVDCFNNLFKRNAKKVIFYSFDESKAPDFLVPILSEFDVNNDACYHGYVLKAFETKEICIDYLFKRRAITPVYYSHIPTPNPIENHARNEISRQIAIDQKSLVKKEIDSLRQAILQNRHRPSIDLTESDIEAFQHGLDEQITIDEEFSMLHEESCREIMTDDCLSGKIPFQILSVRE